MITGTLKEKPRRTVKIYYNDIGEIQGASVVEVDELKVHSFIDVPWEDGKLFLSGERSTDDFYVNEEKRIAKALPSGISRGNRYHIFDMIDSLHENKETADVVIIQTAKEITITTDKLEYPLFITYHRNPFYIYDTVFESTVLNNIAKSISIYTEENNKKLKIYYEKPWL